MFTKGTPLPGTKGLVQTALNRPAIVTDSRHSELSMGYGSTEGIVLMAALGRSQTNCNVRLRLIADLLVEIRRIAQFISTAASPL